MAAGQDEIVGVVRFNDIGVVDSKIALGDAKRLFF